MKTRLFAILLLFVSLCRAQTPTLWGIALNNEVSSSAIIFSFNSGTGVMHTQLSFGDSPFNGSPETSLIMGNNGLLYGVLPNGGSGDEGILFSFDIVSSNYAVLYTFNCATGCNPVGPLLAIGNDQLLGVAIVGGAFEKGSIFSYNITTNTYTDLHDFGDTLDGSNPNGPLLGATNGMLYGTTQMGGVNNDGTIYSYNNSTGQYTRLSSLADSNGKYPWGLLTQINDTMLYGIAAEGGALGQGVIYSYSISSGITTGLHSFDNTQGANPVGSLIKAGNGHLYGLTTSGGANGHGVIYEYRPTSNLFLVDHNFGSFVNDGNSPGCALIQASNGLLYGTTQTGGTNQFGTIFSFDPATDTELVLHSFNFPFGDDPQGSLLEIDLPTAIPDLSPSQLQISPNPTTGQFAIQLPNVQGNYRAAVYNTLGQKVEELSLAQTRNTFNLSNQATGMYFVRVQTEAGVVEGKVMVVR